MQINPVRSLADVIPPSLRTFFRLAFSWPVPLIFARAAAGCSGAGCKVSRTRDAQGMRAVTLSVSNAGGRMYAKAARFDHKNRESRYRR